MQCLINATPLWEAGMCLLALVKNCLKEIFAFPVWKKSHGSFIEEDLRPQVQYNQIMKIVNASDNQVLENFPKNRLTFERGQLKNVILQSQLSSC